MKKDNLKDDALMKLMAEACPEPLHDRDFTSRVIDRIVKDKRQKEEALQYWHEQTGMALPKTWWRRLSAWLMSPMLAVLAVVVMIFVYRHEIFLLLRQCWDGQYILANGIEVSMSIVMPVACGILSLGVLGGAIAMLSSED